MLWESYTLFTKIRYPPNQDCRWWMRNCYAYLAGNSMVAAEHATKQKRSLQRWSRDVRISKTLGKIWVSFHQR